MDPALAEKIHDNRYLPYLLYEHPDSDPDPSFDTRKNQKQENQINKIVRVDFPSPDGPGFGRENS